MLSKLFKKHTEINSVSSFWQWFVEHESDFFNKIKRETGTGKEVIGQIIENVQKYHEGVFGLIGFDEDGKLELVLTADGVLKNIVFVEDLVSAAPVLNNWRFTSLKPQQNSFDYSIDWNGFEFNKSKLKFYANIDDNYPDEISILLTHPDYSDEDVYSQIINGSLIYLDNCLGEINMACRIDYIDLVKETDIDAKNLIPIEKLDSYLNWREQEYLQKYEQKSTVFPEESYVVMEGELDGTPIFAVINNSWANWQFKPMFTWLIKISIDFEGNETGLPDTDQLSEIQKLEDEVIARLNPKNICVVGRVTNNHQSSVFIYSNEYRECSRIVYEILKEQVTDMDLDYQISKDKYWRAVEQYL